MKYLKPQIILILITALAGAAGAQTITIKTDPPDLDVTVDGEYIGKAPVTVEKRFDNTIKITISGEGIEEFSLYSSPPGLYQNKIIEIDAEKGTGISRDGVFRPEKPANFKALAILAGVVLLIGAVVYFAGSGG